MNKAVFLDRDGIINKEIGAYVYRQKDFILNDGVEEALLFWQSRGYKLIVITNQGGIAKGMYTHDDVRRLHHYLEDLLNKAGVKLDAIYYSPHHSEISNSLSRKPGSLMIERALARYSIDPSQSVMIGDRPRDVEAAEGAGVRGILVDSNIDLRTMLDVID
ncbi:MAG: D-glycero-alpha-D-manno-heptose-1,7-bisphosphate 7-phosphatase [Bacteroidia bacterium]